MVIVMVLAMIPRFFSATLLSDSDRLEFSSGAEGSCFTSQRKLKENAGLTDSQLREYCFCFSSSIDTRLMEEPDDNKIDTNKIVANCRMRISGFTN